MRVQLRRATGFGSTVAGIQTNGQIDKCLSMGGVTARNPGNGLVLPIDPATRATPRSLWHRASFFGASKF